jgi:hypothetical protein
MPPKKRQRLEKEYRAAIGEYDLLTSYLKAANLKAAKGLTKPARELLTEFAALAKCKAERLRRMLAPRRS